MYYSWMTVRHLIKWNTISHLESYLYKIITHSVKIAITNVHRQFLQVKWGNVVSEK